ncbi:MAG: hypothetical protein DMF56_21530 [Acidobacteria bacterium]|nr:MAG: hypothetical protein DMF56_21530 [Acidobacteriota bacterium]
MNRWLALVAVVLLVGCASSKPAAQAEIDPVTDPTVVGAVNAAAVEGSAEAEEAARQGRKIGRVVGVLAAVLGGPQSESLDDTINRYRNTRDAITATSAAIGATKGAVNGAKRGFVFDQQFAELHDISGIEATRPFPDQIDVRIAKMPNSDMLATIALVFIGREERIIHIEAAGSAASDIRDSLIALGMNPSSLHSHQNDEERGVVLHVGYVY